MQDDDRERALAELLLRVEQVVDGPATLESLYALESGFVYTDSWFAARERLREEITRLGIQEPWISQLRRLPANLKFWIPFIGRHEITDASIRQAAEQWEAKGPERIFGPHRHMSRISGGIAALHVSLLADLDPVAAVEYIAALPNEHFIWPAAFQVHIDALPAVVDRVLEESSSGAAALLCLACELDAQRSLVETWRNKARWRVDDESAADDPATILESAWMETIPKRFETIAKSLVARKDAGAVIGPWMRHLVRSVNRGLTPHLVDRAQIARIALDAMLAALPGLTFELERAEKPDPACVVSRILLAETRGVTESQWDEWVELVCTADRALDDKNEIYWGAAGHSLRRAADPLAAWTSAVRRLEPLLRARARRIELGIDPLVHLIMPAVNAAAAMGPDGEQLWWALYERARRHFCVDSPPENAFGYRLCSYVFGAFPRVFGNDRDESLDRALGLLPTKEHVEWAREQLPANQRRGEHGSDAARDKQGADPTQRPR